MCSSVFCISTWAFFCHDQTEVAIVTQRAGGKAAGEVSDKGRPILQCHCATCASAGIRAGAGIGAGACIGAGEGIGAGAVSGASVEVQVVVEVQEVQGT